MSKEKIIIDDAIDTDKQDIPSFGKRWGDQTFVLTEKDIEALRAGKVIALDVNKEYVAFIRAERKMNAKQADAIDAKIRAEEPRTVAELEALLNGLAYKIVPVKYMGASQGVRVILEKKYIRPKNNHTFLSPIGD